LVDHTRLQPLLDQSPGRERAELPEKMRMVDSVERRRQVRVERPPPARVLPAGGVENGFDRIVAAAARPESVGSRLEPCFPLGLQRTNRNSLKCAVGDHGNPERAPALGLGDEHASDGLGCPRPGAVLYPVGRLGLGLGQRRRSSVDPRRLSAGVDLRHASHARQRVGAGAEHQFLQVADLLEVPRPRCREDALSQPPYVLFDLSPVDGLPVGEVVLGSVHHGRDCRGSRSGYARLRRRGVQLVPRFRRLRSSVFTGSPGPRQHPFGLGQLPLSGRLCGTIGGGADHAVPVSRFLSAAGVRFLDRPAPAGDLGLPHGRLTSRHWRPDPVGVVTLRTYEMRPGWVPPLLRERRCPYGRYQILSRRLPPHSGRFLNPGGAFHQPR
jgi:hypothetical protein